MIALAANVNSAKDLNPKSMKIIVCIQNRAYSLN